MRAGHEAVSWRVQQQGPVKVTAMSSPDAAERVAAESWFLKRGLPAVLTRRARWRRLWGRSAPAFAAYATFMALVAVINLIPGDDGDDTTIAIGGSLSAADIATLVLMAVTVPAAITAAVYVARISSVHGRRTAAFC